MTEEAKHLIQECKRKKEWEERYRSNYIEFDDYFKYSGEVEPTRVLITRYEYNYNTKCNNLCEHYIKKEDYEKLWEKYKSKSGRFAEEVDAFYWHEAEDSLWSN